MRAFGRIGGEPIEFFAYLEEDLFGDGSPDHVVRDWIFLPRAPARRRYQNRAWLVLGDIDTMNDSSANDRQQNSTSSSVDLEVHLDRRPLVGKRPIHLLLALNAILFVVVGLGFLLNTATIYPSNSTSVSTELSDVTPQDTDSSDSVTSDAGENSTAQEPVSVTTPPNGVSLPLRVLDFIQFFVLILIGVICGLISLGCLALISDRPFGDLKTSIIGISACLWFSALALFVPSPERFLLDPIQYSVAGLILWLSSSLILGLGYRVGLSFTGGTVATLGIMALGSRIVVWATWS
jgi:hypothetical protein